MGNIKLVQMREAFTWDSIRPIDGGVETLVAAALYPPPVRPPSVRTPCVAAGTSGHPQRKMQDKQGRDAASVPVMPEVAVHRDGGLWRPVLWKGRRGLTEMQAAETSRNDVLTVFSEGSSATPPPPPRYSSYNPVSASVFVSPDRLRFPAFPPPSPHRCAAATCRLSTTVAADVRRESDGDRRRPPGGERVRGLAGHRRG